MNDSETTEKADRFELWREQVAIRLTDLKAFDLIKGKRKEAILTAWYIRRFTPKQIADLRNRRLSQANERTNKGRATGRPAWKGGENYGFEQRRDAVDIKSTSLDDRRSGLPMVVTMKSLMHIEPLEQRVKACISEREDLSFYASLLCFD